MLKALQSRLRLRTKIRKSAQRGEEELLLIQHLLGSGTAIDIGANKGIYSLVMSRYADRVIAVEPNTDLSRDLDVLPRNCEVIYCAVGEQNSTEVFYIPVTESGRNRPNIGSLLEIEGEHVVKREVEVRTLDDIAAGVEDLQLIKIDVEGAEIGCLKGACEVLRKHKPTLIVECLSDEAQEEISEWLEGFGYQPFRYIGHRLQHNSQVQNARHRVVDRNVIYFPMN
ncbi:MAG TPA: hypothetical protein DCG12_01480 [Planctomycetaceae bacterium]|nr:hypothetical protein [Planctomycetaceae bacterium]|tara:strand:+ start:276 stop:953 length:678 start_codon:yes stop_codon:yes gene_type:complete